MGVAASTDDKENDPDQDEDEILTTINRNVTFLVSDAFFLSYLPLKLYPH